MKSRITGRTKVLGIIGSPITHSLSPLMQNAAIEALGLDFVYVPFAVPADGLCAAVHGLRNLGVAGFNVTIPFKTAIIPYLDKLSPEAELIGAVNTVNREGGFLVGYNTDGAGLLKSLAEDLDFTPKGAHVLVLGAGGAARGAIASLCKAGVESVTIANRTRNKGEELLSCFKIVFPQVKLALSSLDVLGSSDLLHGIDLIVNTTSVGMDNTSFNGLDTSLMNPATRIYDMVYAPLETPLLTAAKAMGLKSANGIGMLAAQGEIAFAVWTGCAPPSGLMKSCLLTVVKAK